MGVWWRVARRSRLAALLLLLLILILLLPLISHHYLAKFTTEDLAKSEEDHKKPLLDTPNAREVSDLKFRIEEMSRIKNSVRAELHELENRRQSLQRDISILSQKVEEIKVEHGHRKLDLERLQVSLAQAEQARKELQEQSSPQILLPLRLLPSTETAISPPPPLPTPHPCQLHSCFDYSRCSITSDFPVYFYHPDDSWGEVDRTTKSLVTEALNSNVHITFDPTVACVYVVLVGQLTSDKEGSSLEKYLLGLAHWNGDGRNHLILNLARTAQASAIPPGTNTGRAMVVQSHFLAPYYRDGFDLVAPPLLSLASTQARTTFCPLRRKYLLSFQGQYHREDGKTEPDYPDDFLVHSFESLKKTKAPSQDKFLFDFTCNGAITSGLDTEWSLCGSLTSRSTILSSSTFNLILAPTNTQIVSSFITQMRLYEALEFGSVPVILGNHLKLPFSSVIDWSRAALVLPKARVTEIHYILRSLSDADIFQLRRQGFYLWKTFLAMPQSVVNTILANVRTLIQIPPPAVAEEASPSVFNASFQVLKLETLPMTNDAEENLGPIEPPMASPKFQHNYSLALSHSFDLWNSFIDPFVLYPSTPFDPILPSEAKFFGSGFGFRPIGQGSGGAGKEFSEALGGNHPREQFTVVMLTYEREAILVESLGRLRGVPFLHKVLVVWNSPRPPVPDLRWPDIGVPIVVVRTKKNSLNNRFLPYDAIETDAILSVDDDVLLRHDEIVFGFRVWREARDRIVGFPGRYHAWDLQHGGWLYNSNYSCELSMVLTGAAFFHKYYSYMYSYWMPQAIRDKVDEYMNCEDIAMNFLVSHLTRKPPIKVTSRWTFRCPGCAVSLFEEESHFLERHICINHFLQEYGYLPLLHTQLRADSVLFKTRIPHDKHKCFKYI